MRVGTLKQIYRFPFKSMLGELLNEAEVGPKGLIGDRCWSVRDEARGDIGSAKRIPALLQCKARYPEQPVEGAVGPTEITLPDGSSFLSDDTDADARLSQTLGREVTVWPIVPAENLAHYRRSSPSQGKMEAELRSLLGLEADEPLPDFSELPEEVLQYASPPGTYFDAFPLHVVTQASLNRLQSLRPDSQIDALRFRPNFLIDTEDTEGLVETAWTRKQLRIGGLTMNITINCLRCVMTTLGFANLSEDPKIMRTLVREARQNFGVYATVATPGRVSVGDSVELSS